MPKLCTKCGEDHEMLFTKEVIDIYDLVCSTSDQLERAELMIELAQTFIGVTDDTDEHLGEDVHDMLTKVIQNQMVYERSAMALARVLMRTLPGYIEAHKDMEDDDIEEDKDKTKAN